MDTNKIVAAILTNGFIPFGGIQLSEADWISTYKRMLAALPKDEDNTKGSNAQAELESAVESFLAKLKSRPT